MENLTTIKSVEFNTEEKAKKCSQLLGKRFINTFVFYYGKKKISGYKVYYFIAKT